MYSLNALWWRDRIFSYQHLAVHFSIYSAWWEIIQPSPRSNISLCSWTATYTCCLFSWQTQNHRRTPGACPWLSLMDTGRSIAPRGDAVSVQEATSLEARISKGQGLLEEAVHQSHQVGDATAGQHWDPRSLQTECLPPKASDTHMQLLWEASDRGASASLVQAEWSPETLDSQSGTFCPLAMAQGVKNQSAMQETEETLVWSLGQENPLEEEMATHSSILA